MDILANESLLESQCNGNYDLLQLFLPKICNFSWSAILQLDDGGSQLDFVSISRVMNHMTRYEFKSSHSGKFILKNPLQHLLSSRNAVISTNESTQIITGHVIIQRGLSGLYLDYTYKLQLKTTIVLDLSSYYSSLLPF